MVITYNGEIRERCSCCQAALSSEDYEYPEALVLLNQMSAALLVFHFSS